MRVNRFIITLSLLLGILLPGATAAGQQLVILSATNAPAYQRATEHLRQRLLEHNHTNNNSYILSSDRVNPVLHQALIQASQIIAIGSKACDHAAKHSTSAHVACGFITRNSFNAIQAQVPGRQNLSALYIDQPLQRLLNLGNLLSDGQQMYRVGLLSANTQSTRSVIAASEAANNNLKITQAELQLTDNPVKILEPLMFNSDLLIVQPSAKLFNRLVAKLILQLSVRYKVPVIGFSQKYTEAGAMVSLYASPEDIGDDLAAAFITSITTDNGTQTTRHGRHFSVSVNNNVARKLRSAIDTDDLEHRLKIMESSTDVKLHSH